MTMVVPIDKELYWKVYCWTGVEKSICKFVFPKYHKGWSYATEPIFMMNKEIIKPILENLLEDKIDQEEHLDESLVNRINDIFCKLSRDIKCQICSHDHSPCSIVQKKIPICAKCSSLLC